MKKLLLVLVMFTFILSIAPINAFGITNKTPKAETDHETEKLTEKSYSPKQIKSTGGTLQVIISPGGGGSSHLYWVATIKILFLGGTQGMSDSYTDSSKTVKYAIDHIAVKVREYAHGGLIGSATDSEYNLPHAGITYGKGVGYSGVEGFGNHTFEDSEYESWYPETYVN